MSSIEALHRKTTRMLEALGAQQTETVKAVLIMPYKDHINDEACQCVNPKIEHRGSYVFVSYHQRAGIDEEIERLLNEQYRSATP